MIFTYYTILCALTNPSYVIAWLLIHCFVGIGILSVGWVGIRPVLVDLTDLLWNKRCVTTREHLFVLTSGHANWTMYCCMSFGSGGFIGGRCPWGSLILSGSGHLLSLSGDMWAVYWYQINFGVLWGTGVMVVSSWYPHTDSVIVAEYGFMTIWVGLLTSWVLLLTSPRVLYWGETCPCGLMG